MMIAAHRRRAPWMASTSSPSWFDWRCSSSKPAPSAAVRAPGHPQGSFALEATMDELAAKLGMDPLEFRMKNDPSEIRREEFRTIEMNRGQIVYDSAEPSASTKAP